MNQTKFTVLRRHYSAARLLLATPARVALAFASLLACALPASAQFKDQIGFTQLQAEYPNLPAGRNLTILEIEFAVDWTNFNWAVAPGGELAGRSLTYFPAGTNPTGFSDHATGVAALLVGSTTSIIPQVPALISTVEEKYVTAALHTGETIAPSAPAWDLESTTSCWNDSTWSVEILRRLDWRVDQQGVTFVAVVLNGATNPLPYVFSSAYNVITIGVTAGTHSSGDTLIEGVGRIKPDIVAPNDYTSGATPIIASCAGLLIDQAKSDARFTLAKDPRVIKALLLAGATKQEIPGWSNSPTQPLDTHFGAGQVNIGNSYHMLMNGRQPTGNAWLSASGWDKSTSGTGRYFIEVPTGQTATFSAVLTWHRTITPNANWSVLTPSLADLNLRLSTASADFSVGTLVAESRSAIDNVEHVYQASLPAGRYVLEVTGPAGVSYGIAWRSNPVDLGPPTITTQPQGRTITAGLSGIFIAVASGYPATTYQWQRLPAGSGTWANVSEGGSYSGSTSTVLTVSNASAGMSGDQFRCVITNATGVSTSTAVTLSVSGAVLLRYPVGIAADSAGNFYVADSSDDTIRKITPAGVVSTLAGSTGAVGTQDGTGTNARFNQPGGLAVDAAGNVYVADTGNATIRKITTAGVVTTLAGSAANRGNRDGVGSAAWFNSPSGIAVDASGNLYVADAMNATIRKITPDGTVSTLAGAAGAPGDADGSGSGARFNFPSGIATDSRQIYVADCYNHTIRRITPDGVVTTVAGSAGISGGNDGTGIYALFNQPAGVAVDPASDAGGFYVADTGNGTIRRVMPGGGVTTLAGVAGIAGLRDGAGGNALFNQPRGLVVDGNRNLWVVDTGNGAIRKVTPNGVVTTLALTADTPTPLPPSGGTTTPPPATGNGSTSGGGGGGGAPSEWFCGALLLLAAVRIFQGRAKASGPATPAPV
jgi:sugar lactone lactonase YvrE